MILIPDKPVFVRDPNGQLASFDLGKLNQDLREAFKLNGLHDTWLVDQFSLTMEEKLRSETARKTPLAETDIDTLMSSVLMASGYPDVAGSFTELRGASPIRKILATLAPWNDQRIRNVIIKRLPLTQKQADILVPRCHQTFQQLGMTHVSDNFIAELAIHLVHQHHEHQNPEPHQEPHQEQTEERTSRHLRTPAELKAQADDFTRTLIDQQIIAIYPVAPIFPRAQLALSLQNFCRIHMAGWPSELSLTANFGPTAKAIATLLRTCRQDIEDLYPAFADVPAYVVLTHYQDFIQNYYGDASKVDRIAFDQGVRTILHAFLVKRADFNLKLHFNG